MRRNFGGEFQADYVQADGDIAHYFPDFLVKLSATEILIVETKGQADLKVPLKMQRLRQWCADINQAQAKVRFDCVYVDQENFEHYRPTSFQQLIDAFREYQGEAPESNNALPWKAHG
jgi:type III restriction enzyme